MPIRIAFKLIKEAPRLITSALISFLHCFMGFDTRFYTKSANNYSCHDGLLPVVEEALKRPLAVVAELFVALLNHHVLETQVERGHMLGHEETEKETETRGDGHRAIRSRHLWQWDLRRRLKIDLCVL